MFAKRWSRRHSIQFLSNATWSFTCFHFQASKQIYANVNCQMLILKDNIWLFSSHNSYVGSVWEVCEQCVQVIIALTPSPFIPCSEVWSSLNQYWVWLSNIIRKFNSCVGTTEQCVQCVGNNNPHTFTIHSPLAATAWGCSWRNHMMGSLSAL